MALASFSFGFNALVVGAALAGMIVCGAAARWRPAAHAGWATRVLVALLAAGALTALPWVAGAFAFVRGGRVPLALALAVPLVLAPMALVAFVGALVATRAPGSIPAALRWLGPLGVVACLGAAAYGLAYGW